MTSKHAFFLARLLILRLILHSFSIAAPFDSFWLVSATAIRPATAADCVIVNNDGFVDWRHASGMHWHVLA